MTRKRWMVLAATAAVVALVAVVLVAVRLTGDDEPKPTGLAYAVTLAPADAQRLLWTDWAGVRAELGLDLDATSTGEEVDDLFNRGFDADLTSATALDSSALVLQDRFGFSPASLDFELFAQSETAATLVMKLGSGVTTDDVAAALRSLGYVEPDDADGIWGGSSDLEVAGQVTPELTFISLDEAAGLVFASDQSAGVQIALKAAAKGSSQPVPTGVVSALGSPISAALYASAEACTSLAMGNADESDQAASETLVAQAGKINPLTGFGMGAEPGGGVRVGLGFENADQARTNADTRAILAAGPAPGQGGDFTDRFIVDKVSAQGSVVRMDLDPVEGATVLSDLSTGPVLFATC